MASCRTWRRRPFSLSVSATVAAAIVALEEGVAPTEALRRVSERNPRANPLEHQRQDLLRGLTARAGAA